MPAPIVLKFLDELRETQFLSTDRLVAYQRALLDRLLRHARAHVPFYRDSGRLDPMFRANGSVDWDRWHDIPPLTRKELQENYGSLQSEVLGAEHGRRMGGSTSGSTGEPVKVQDTFLFSSSIRLAQFLRDTEKHRIDPTKPIAYLKPAGTNFVAGEPPAHRRYWCSGMPQLGLEGDRYDVADTQSTLLLIDIVAGLRPTYMRVQPVTLELMTANDRDGKLAAAGIEAMITVGERFSPESKKEVVDHFGCRLMDHYGSIECGRIATSCAQCGRYHIDADVNVVDMVDDAGKPARAGDTAWLFITPLYNYAMPLIRYDQADQAVVGAPDGCTILLPTLDDIFGKERTVFRFPGGVSLRPAVSNKAMIDCLGAQAYQIAQVAADRCEVRIVPGRLAKADMRFDEVTALLQRTWYDKLQVDYRLVDELPRRSARSKVPNVVYEVPDAPAGA